MQAINQETHEEHIIQLLNNQATLAAHSSESQNPRRVKATDPKRP
jgi:hypothetical protein